MKLIALDSSGLVATVAVLEDEIVRAEYTVDYKKTHSQTLLPMLDAITQMIDLDMQEVDAIAVAAGPGSFTGLRIGSATAKGLALALAKPIVEVPTLAGLASNLWGAPGLICPIMDARREQVYNGLYRFARERDEGSSLGAFRLETVEEQRALSVAELIRELNGREELQGHAASPVFFLGDGVAVYREMLDKGLTVPHVYAPAGQNRQRAASVGMLAFRLLREGKAIPSAEHAPLYLRKSQAEREREEQEGLQQGAKE